MCGVAIFACAGWGALRAVAQQSPVIVASDSSLPDAPGLGTPIDPAGGDTAPQNGSAAIAGTVQDTNGNVIESARVVLTLHPGKGERVLQSGSNGEFSFEGLPAGTYKLTVTGPGMGTYISAEIPLHGAEMRLVPHVVLPLAATATEITVSGDRAELAEEQVHIAVEQRVMGILPNFYSSYDWHAPPMMSKQKFELAFRSVTDPVAFAGAGARASFEQGTNTFPGYGQGVTGYSKRFGAAYADDVSGRMLSSAIFPSLLHQDPRYFYRGSGSNFSRAMYAICGALITRGDNGHRQPNYSHVLGSFGAGALSNLYYPSSSRGVSLTLMNGLIETAGHAGNNLLREFVFKGLTTKVPSYANGKP